MQSDKRVRRNWQRTFDEFLSTGYDCVGWKFSSLEEAKTFKDSGSKSRFRPEGIRMIKRGTLAYIFRDDAVSSCVARDATAIRGDMRLLVKRFLASDYDCAGLFMSSRTEAEKACSLSFETSALDVEIATTILDRSMWHFRPVSFAGEGFRLDA